MIDPDLEERLNEIENAINSKGHFFIITMLIIILINSC